MKTATTILTAAAMLFGTATARAESPGKAKNNPPAPAMAKATRAAEAPPAMVVVKKVDPLEAALAQALALSASPSTSQPVEPGKKLGLADLRRSTRHAAALKLNRRGHNRLLPTNETVVRLGTQPLDMKVVRAVVKARTSQIHYCHESLAARGKITNGAVTARFVIEPRGNVSTVEVAAGAGGAELERCIAKRISSWSFPAADAPTEVDYPFVFDIAGSTLTAK